MAQSEASDPLVVDPLRGKIQMAGRYATDWPETEARLAMEYVKAALPDTMALLGPDSVSRWWLCDDDALPKRPGMATGLSVGEQLPRL
jgi:hypothetical protein